MLPIDISKLKKNQNNNHLFFNCNKHHHRLVAAPETGRYHKTMNE